MKLTDAIRFFRQQSANIWFQISFDSFDGESEGYKFSLSIMILNHGCGIHFWRKRNVE